MKKCPPVRGPTGIPSERKEGGMLKKVSARSVKSIIRVAPLVVRVVRIPP